jgi:arylsulfatase A-like enzyme
MDVVPTVLDVLGVKAPPALDGQSLLPLLTPGAEQGERDAFSEFVLFGNEEQKALRTGRFKVIYTLQTKRIKLYDLRADPQERQNVARDMVSLASKLLTRMNAWVKETRRAAGGVERPGDVVVVSHEKEIMERLKALGYVKGD